MGHRNLWNDGVDGCRAVMVMSKQGQDSEWRGVPVCLYVCVCGETPVMCFPICLSAWMWVAVHVQLHISELRLLLSSLSGGQRCMWGFRRRTGVLEPKGAQKSSCFNVMMNFSKQSFSCTIKYCPSGNNYFSKLTLWSCSFSVYPVIEHMKLG